MAEEAETKKPKATLIKKSSLPEPAPVPEEPSTERRKVVRLKKAGKKRIVVRRAPAKEPAAAAAGEKAVEPAAPRSVAASAPEVAAKVAAKAPPSVETEAPAEAKKEPVTASAPVPAAVAKAKPKTVSTPPAEAGEAAEAGGKVAADQPAAPAGDGTPPARPAAKETAPATDGDSPPVKDGEASPAPRVAARKPAPRPAPRPGEPRRYRPTGPNRIPASLTGAPRQTSGPGRAGRVGGRPVGSGPPRPPGARFSRPSGPPGVGGPPRGPGGPGGPPGAGGRGGPPGPAPGGKGKKFFPRGKKRYNKRRFEEHSEKLLQHRKKSDLLANPVPKNIDILEAITVAELARKMNIKASDLIHKLMSMGTMVTMNQQIDADTATILAEEYGCKVKIVSLFDETVIEEEEVADGDLQTRPPIVTVMGHVDHGKTLLLDAIRETNVVDNEHGGITQHIGAYSVMLDSGAVTFLDTPGHEAFTLMRQRGAQVTDLVILVVAADDGVMPQTVEAINHAKAAEVPIIVAINKMDLPEANPDRIKQQLSEYDLMPEDWGGSTLYCPVSALKKEGVKELLDAILLQAELLDLKAPFDTRASGRVVESKVDLGRGIVSTVLVQKGTLRIGDSFVAGVFAGRIRAMFDDHGGKIEVAPPSVPVEILGLDGIPEAGDPFQVTENERAARTIGEKRQELRKVGDAGGDAKITLDNLYDRIREGDVQELNVIIKADVHGSVEALQSALTKLSTQEIRLSVIHAAAGAINKDDVRLAATSDAIILAFNIRPTPTAQTLAEEEKVEIRRYTVIYEAIEDVRKAMEGALSPVIHEERLGSAEVRSIFKISRLGTIAGCHVLDGKIRRGAPAVLARDGKEIYRSTISSLKRFKDDAREVDAGYECGLQIENYNDIKVGDVVEVFVLKEVAQKLEDTKASSSNGAAEAERVPAQAQES